MYGFFNTGFNNSQYPQQLNYLFQGQQVFLDNQRLLEILFGHKEVIEKLLENQTILKTRLQGQTIVQTTDTEHQIMQSDNSQGNLLLQRIHNKLRQQRSILLKNNPQCIAIQKKEKNKPIEIISTCPLEDIEIGLQIEQKDEKKQFKINSQTNKKCCQTKNIIKNYGKSILMFFRRNKPLIKKILQQFNIDENQFYAEFQKFRDRVNSITELKLFWTEQGNKFAKVYRIVSNLYLKKYSLKHTFSSRVRNYGVHIKYRKRLLDVLKNPEDFTSIKYL